MLNRVLNIVGSVLLVGGVVALFLLGFRAFDSGTHVVELDPQQMTFEIDAKAAVDELIDVRYTYQGTGNWESVLVTVTDAVELTSIRLFIADGELARDSWSCSGKDGPAQQVEEISSDEIAAAVSISKDAGGVPFGPEPTGWDWAATAKPASGTTLSISCQRSGELWDFVSGVNRAFLPPVTTIAVVNNDGFDLTTTRDMWFVGEAVASPAITHFGTPLVDRAADGEKTGATAWRDDPLLLLDTTVQTQLNAVLFLLSALLGALIGAGISWLSREKRAVAEAVATAESATKAREAARLQRRQVRSRLSRRVRIRSRFRT